MIFTSLSYKILGLDFISGLAWLKWKPLYSACGHQLCSLNLLGDWKGRKVAKHCVFPMIWGSGGSKSRLAKAAGAEPAGQMRDEKVHAVVARSTFPSQNAQNKPAPDHFWQLRCRKKCTPLWREAHFQVKMYKNTPGSDHFWQLKCRKSARRCGAKHISKS